MKKISSLVFVGLMTSSVFGHNLWVKASNEDVVKAQMIYGHDFPNPEPIAQERLSLFNPIEIVAEKETLILSQKGEEYNYEGKKPLQEGTYIVKVVYKPTAWIEKADGKWEMNKTRKDSKEEVKHCGIYSMFGKSILVVGDSDGAFATKSLGKGFEITPLVKASEFKKDTPIKFRLTRDGKRVKMTDVYGSFGGFSEDEMSMAFYAKTDLKGEFVFKPLKSGLWYLKADYKQESGNADCEHIGDKTTLSFEVR